MAGHVQGHAPEEPRLPQQRAVHAHDLGALQVHRAGLEVVHGHVALGPHRVRGGAAVLEELRAAQSVHVLDALHACAFQQVGGEPLSGRRRSRDGKSSTVRVISSDACKHKGNRIKT